MDDFLHNLRSGNLKSPDRNRRQYNDTQYKGPQRRNMPDRRKREQDIPAQTESLQAIKEILKSMLDNQKSMTEAIEIRNRTEIQKASAIEKIALMLEALMPQANEMAAPQTELQTTPQAELQTTPQAELQPAPPEAQDPPLIQPEPESLASEPANKDAATIICRMRNEGLSYAKIAEHLEAEGIPTVSGKGKWRGQSVQRIYQKADV
jgi:hypothetical protein